MNTQLSMNEIQNTKMIQKQLRDKKVLSNGQNDKRQADTRDKVHKTKIRY